MVSQSVRLSHHVIESLTSQSLTQPTQIKWLLMNFKQVLSHSSTCALLQPLSLLLPLPSSIRQGASLICSLSFHPLCTSLLDILKLSLSHALNGVPAAFSLGLLLLFLSLLACFPFSSLSAALLQNTQNILQCVQGSVVLYLLCLPVFTPLLFYLTCILVRLSCCPNAVCFTC